LNVTAQRSKNAEAVEPSLSSPLCRYISIKPLEEVTIGDGGLYVVRSFTQPETCGNALPDPLAEAAPGIIQHMNADHADALRLIARRFAGEAADEAFMPAVDRLGFHLRLRSGDRIHGRRVAFLREVKSSDAARVALVEMVRQARSPEAV
jgi:heme iron utilization protein